MSEAKKKGRGAASRIVILGGNAIRVRTVIALADTLGVARITLKRVWEKVGVLPEPTFVDESGTRWYSDAYIGAIADMVRFWRKTPRGHRSLATLSDLISKKWKAKKIV